MIGTDVYHISIDPPDSTDYRLSPIEITSIDQPQMLVLEPLKATLLGEGVIRLYRETEDDNVLQHSNLGDETMLLILAVPTYFTATDLLGYMGENFMKDISHVRILKSEKANRFLVLLKFRDIVRAAEFKFAFDGKSFNLMEPETCHVVYIKSVRIDYTLEEEDLLLPFIMSDPFTETDTTLVELPSCPVCLERMDAEITGLLTIACQHTFHCQCLSKWRDDSCPICRYSNNISNREVRRSTRRRRSQPVAPTSLETVMESQEANEEVIHGSSRVQEGSSQERQGSITSSLEATNISSESNENCDQCSTTTDLWVCLVCGNVGCGRYAPEQHSLKHFVNTGHCFAMELESSRVWDYAGDSYVHRLLTNQSDGKLVELPEKHQKDESSTDKVEEVEFEYSLLLINQLASQREYYESLLLDQRRPLVSSVSSASQSVTLKEFLELQNKVKELTKATQREVPALKDKLAGLTATLERRTEELTISDAINDANSKKAQINLKVIADLKKEIAELKETNVGLGEQVSDLMFFLDSQNKFKDESQDVIDGTVIVQAPPDRKTRRKGR